MIALVEGAKRQRTPNEIALSILLRGLTLVFLMAVVTLRPFGVFAGETVGTVELIALLVCLIPTTIGGLLSAIGIAGMDRVARFNVLAMSGRAVEASGDVDVILLDKTGTITYGNRLASPIVPRAGRHRGGGPERGARGVDPRRDAGGPLDRRAGPAAPRRARQPPAGPATRPGFGASDATIVEDASPSAPRPAPAASRSGRRRAGPQGRGRRDRRRPRRRDAGRGRWRRPRRSPTAAPRRSPLRRTARARASSSSRTPSRRAWSSASTSSAGWASGR